ncbi:hypothetical protein [Actinomadura macrotermitis]|uniref:Uncharacterized protein n=1 Tax=Actinomadura macrotermitis TaxID=2585200 RepID=A0A7K0C416_9ACTN|nr:hypothetical protein [Actinomadura macrotermitis]MQY07842.1 hypothetical protein [Actinomadura macrotermitis]
MSNSDDLGHAPEHPDDEFFAPVTQGGDATGGTTSAYEDEKDTEDLSGTGVPGVRTDRADTLPPDPEGVAEAERTDDSR